MNNPESQAIIKRYFAAVDELIAKGDYDSLYEFANEHKIDRRSFYFSYKEPASDRFQPSWVTPLIKYGISLDWLFTGKGRAFPKPVKSITIAGKQLPKQLSV